MPPRKAAKHPSAAQALFGIPSEELIGHSRSAAWLKTVFAAGRHSHAYLFVGPAGVGKRALAKALACQLLGASATSLDAHPDYLEVARERDQKTDKLRAGILLEQIKGLRERLSQSSFGGGARIAVIDGADALNVESANALLKTLEEPGQGTVIFLLADHLAGVMLTLRSRSQSFRFGLVPDGPIIDGLVARGTAPDEAGRLAVLAAGRPGLAIRLANDKKTREDAEALQEAVAALPASLLHERCKMAEKRLPPKLGYQEAGERARGILDAALCALSRALRARHGGSSADPAYVALPAPVLAQLLERGLEAKALIEENANPRASLDAFFALFPARG